MNWIAYMKDGTIIKEVEENIPYASLDFDNIERFTIKETGSNLVVPFSCDTGIIRFTNFDLRKLQHLQGGEQLNFHFDAVNGFFRLDKDSVERYNELVIKDENIYYFIEFDQSGVFNINGDKLYAGFEIDGNLIEFKNQPPYNKIIQYKNGYSEIKIRGTTPINKNEKTINYVVGYKKTHRYDEIEFETEYQIIYDLINRYVMLDLILQSNKDLTGKIFLSYGGKDSKIPIRLTTNSPMQTKRVLTVIG